jgi:hypothetical protein
MAGTIVDQNVLKATAAKIGAIVSTALPIVFAFSVSFHEQADASGGSTGDLCALSAEQNEALALVGNLLRAGNFENGTFGGCSYGITLDEIFELGTAAGGC